MNLVGAAINGFLLSLGLLVALVLVRLLIAFANDEPPREAVAITSRWTWGLLGGVASAGAMGLVQAGDIVGMATQFIGSHPFAVSNIGVAAIGAAGLEGLVTLSPSQYLGIAFLTVGVVMVVMEVTD